MHGNLQLDLSEIRLLICDFDGLLMDTEAPYANSLQTAARLLDIELNKEQLEDLKGQSMSAANIVLQAHFGPDFPVSRLREIADQHFELQIQNQTIQLMPGADDLLNYLDHNTELKKAVASSASRNWIQKCGSWLDKHFEIIVTREDAQKAKPHPDLFLEAARLTNTDPEHVLVLEDSNSGVESAKRAGMSVIQIAETISADHIVLKSLREVVNLFKK